MSVRALIQQQMSVRHGTPEQFIEAIRDAVGFAEMTAAEGDAAIARYQARWDGVEEEPETVAPEFKHRIIYRKEEDS